MTTLAYPLWDEYEPTKFAVARVCTLPWPGGSMKCELKACFAEIAGSTTTTHAQRQQQFAAVWQKMTPDQFAVCSRHRVDWVLPARLAVQILRDPSRHLHTDEFKALAKQHGGGDKLRGQIATFYVEPIRVAAAELSDGQHRVCAMRQQQVAEVVVAI